VVAERRVAHWDCEVGLHVLAVPGPGADDLEPDRVSERGEDRDQGDVLGAGMADGPQPRLPI
jgi:hypothetical protein